MLAVSLLVFAGLVGYGSAANCRAMAVPYSTFLPYYNYVPLDVCYAQSAASDGTMVYAKYVCDSSAQTATLYTYSDAACATTGTMVGDAYSCTGETDNCYCGDSYDVCEYGTYASFADCDNTAVFTAGTAFVIDSCVAVDGAGFMPTCPAYYLNTLYWSEGTDYDDAACLTPSPTMAPITPYPTADTPSPTTPYPTPQPTAPTPSPTGPTPCTQFQSGCDNYVFSAAMPRMNMMGMAAVFGVVVAALASL